MLPLYVNQICSSFILWLFTTIGSIFHYFHLEIHLLRVIVSLVSLPHCHIFLFMCVLGRGGGLLDCRGSGEGVGERGVGRVGRGLGKVWVGRGRVWGLWKRGCVELGRR